MDLATLDISPEQAAEQLAYYEAQLATERTTEDAAIAAGYRAAARGYQVIQLSDCLTLGGWFPDGLPRLAVCRADATECWARVSYSPRPDHHHVVFTDREWDRGRARVGLYRVAAEIGGRPSGGLRQAHMARTVVPSIPPQHRPRRSRLHRFLILWEVERWDMTAPRDPALLRHIRGDLWAVMAVWDLTDLERAVLSARAS
jgi:hypothetical protein